MSLEAVIMSVLRRVDGNTKKQPKRQEFLVSGSFTVPAGVTEVFITACGAGGGGASYYSPGRAGHLVTRVPVQVTPGEVIAVTIGAGGPGVTGVNNTAGGNTSFGAYLTVAGARQINKTTVQDGSDFPHAHGVPVGIGGAAVTPSSSGGDGGPFGDGGNGVASGAGSDAAPNTGAGGSSANDATLTLLGGTGGSGRLIVEWEE